MTIIELINAYWEKGLLFLILASGIIEITPIKFNPWSWIIKKIGKIANGELVSRIDDVDKKVESVSEKLEKHIKFDNEQSAVSSRYRILRFADEIQRGTNHSQEHYKQIFKDIKYYVSFCKDNPDFPNQLTDHAIKLIESTYDDKLKENSFLI